jgi:hypothetical protein
MTHGYKLHSIVYYRGKSKGNQRDVVSDGVLKRFVLGQSEHERNALPQKRTCKNCMDLVLKWFDA